MVSRFFQKTRYNAIVTRYGRVVLSNKKLSSGSGCVALPNTRGTRFRDLFLYRDMYRWFFWDPDTRYGMFWNTDSRRLSVVAKESSIQLVLQISILIYDLKYQPVMEVYYQAHPYPTAYWIFIIFIRLISILISIYCTVLALLEDYNMLCYIKYKHPASILQYIIHNCKIVAHILISVGLVFL